MSVSGISTMSVSGIFNTIDPGLLDFEDGTSVHRCALSLPLSDEIEIAEKYVLFDLDSSTTINTLNSNFKQDPQPDEDSVCCEEEGVPNVDCPCDMNTAGFFFLMNDKVYDIDAHDDFGDIELMQDRCANIKCEDTDSDNSYEADYHGRKDPDEIINGPLTPNLPPFQTVFGRNRPDSSGASDDSEDETSIHGQACKKPRKRSKVTRLWEFLADSLGDERYCPLYLEWIDKEKGIFRFKQSKKVAELWGVVKNKTKKMPYEHLSRALRHYYKRNILHRIPTRRLVYQFGPNADGWRARAKVA